MEAISKHVYIALDLKYPHKHNIRPATSGFQEEASLKKVGVLVCVNLLMIEFHIYA
jgi:hypothetical protein